MLNKLQKFSQVLSNWFSNIATVLLLIVFIIGIIDIIGSKLFAMPFPGAIELIGYFLAVLISLAIASTQLLGQHIHVEILVSRLPVRIRAIIKCIISLALLALFVILVWQTFDLGLSYHAKGQVSVALRLPFHYFLYIMSFAFISPCLVFLNEFLEALKELKR